jgi:predicted YcjX-like family ATPase
VPLSGSTRLANENLASAFRSAYERYKHEQVLPALNNLRSCDRLVVLVDLPTILNSGYLMANDVHDLTKDLLDFCNPGKNFLEKLYAISGIPFLLRRSPLEELANTKITRIAFVASKCDLVHESDRDNLVLLLKELVDRLPEEYEGVETDFFACSAVQSTVSDPNGPGLIGVPEFHAENEVLVNVSRVPKRFPDRWQAGEFCFPDFKPRRFPGLKTRPPKQLGLDRVFSFILGSKWTD